MGRYILAMVLWPATLAAQDLPTLHDVTGVAADDVLNARENPRATAAIVGALPPDATGIEVTAISASGGWGRINVAEGVGWVSLDYLAPRPVAEGGAFAQPLRCFGTEPFWGLTVAPGIAATLDRPDADPVAFTPTRVVGSGDTQALVARSDVSGLTAVDESRLTAVVRRAECSDGMSDRLYALDLDLLIEEAGSAQLFSGCCSLSAP